MYSLLRNTLVASILVLCGCTSQTPLPAPLETGYTFESTYKKLLPKFPEIKKVSARVPANVRVERDLSYKQLEHRDLQLDLFIPKRKSGALLPTVVLVHGGGWRTGSRPLYYPLAIELAKRNFAVATVSYRLSGEAQFPAATEDVRDAVAWLQSHAPRYGLDTQRFALAGGSAGGQIAAFVGYSGGSIERDAKSVRVNAVLNIDGLSDFTSPEALPFENDPRKKPSAAGAWLGGRYEEVPETWRQASPIFYIDANAPPTLFVASSQPRFHAGRDAAIAALSGLNITHRSLVYDDAPHSFWLFSPWLQRIANDCADFMQAVFQQE